jgi:putative ABC transport system ATP-binding protein
MIEINNLEFRYPRATFRLKVRQLSVAAGERVAVVGPSGSGKTTLLNLVSGISVPGAGSVRVAGCEIGSLDDRGRRAFRVRNIGAIFQQFELIEYLPVRENILVPYLISRTLKCDESVDRRLQELAETVGLQDKLARPVRKLSQGEQQRVAICRALLPAPRLILADEPTGNLDPVNKRKAIDLLFQQCRAADLTLVAVTHDTGILDGFDRVIDFSQYIEQGESA